MSAVLRLVFARWRSAPNRYVGTVLAVALASAFVLVALAAGTIAGDQAARDSLAAAPPSARALRVTDAAAVSAQLDRRLRQVVSSAARGPVSESLLLGPVRLSGTVVRPAAVVPLSAWVRPAVAASVGPCRPSACPVLLHPSTPLSAPGVRLLPVTAGTGVGSAVPFGYVPGAPGSPLTPVAGDLTGLDALPGLSSDQRTRNWFTLVSPGSLHGWQLTAAAHRLLAAQAELTSGHPELTVATPLAAIDVADAAYASGSRRMLPLAGGGAVILLLFMLLCGTGLRTDQRAELRRLRAAGARTRDAAGFVLAEAAGLALGGLLLGLTAGVAAVMVIAGTSREPGGDVLLHSGRAWVLLAGLFLLAACLIALGSTARSARAGEVALAAAAAALIGLLVDGGSPGGGRAVALVCLAAATGALVIWGATGAALRAGGRATRRATPLARLAVVSLARAPSAPGLAVGLAAAGIGLGGFALTLRATLDRGAADQAAAQVPLEVRVEPGADFRRPLSILPAAGWRQRVGGQPFGVLHTTASLAERNGYASVPMVGVPGAAIALLHGWRSSDGSAPLGTLARRLILPGPARTPGPRLPAGATSIHVGLRSPHLALSATAVLRDPGGGTTLVPLRVTADAASARLPYRNPGLELAAVELTEPTGLEATNGHQNGENPVGTSEGSVLARVGPVRFAGRDRTLVAGLAGWTAVGAASRAITTPRSVGATVVRFTESGQPGIVRPPQPADRRALPVLADPATAMTAGPGGELSLSVDGLPVAARVAGIVRRFPTAGTGPLLLADAAALSATIEAGAPGQGLADEVWIAGADARRLHALLAAPPFSALHVRVRAAIEHAITHAPLARVAGRLLLAEAVLVGALGVAGILLFVLWASDPALLADLSAQGAGPRARRRLASLRTRTVGIAALAGGVVMLGLLLGLALPVSRAIGAGSPDPPYVLVVPASRLAVVWILAAALLAVAAWRPR